VTRRQLQDLEMAIFHLTSKRSDEQGFRTGLLSGNHSGCGSAIATKNHSADEPVPKDFEIHRTRNARSRTGVFRAPSPKRPASRRRRNAQLIPAAGQISESVQAIIGGLRAVLCAIGPRRHNQTGIGCTCSHPVWSPRSGCVPTNPYTSGRRIPSRRARSCSIRAIAIFAG
jgi:hypothetical protein